ncbi:PDR/VanB family oxidoreductase [Streptomyces sp. WAC08241]|uniref:PDR/VanB family oxidoreductase n=1 Tax=Streptomyces sp. WAC08241 TaxID=2487421 RepID=UPI000F7950F6|nr:PDR/VanB family oxidoreductase [Streptomyces sp. WAC08241]RSS46018.1 oxidoreductase [Streptomyces sp. WAC08241]
MNTAEPVRELTVVRAEPEAEGVLGITLADPGGAPLPEWEPGAHVDVVLPSGLVRSYSLCGRPEDREAYRIAVLRVADGRGGSAELHATPLPGRTLTVRGPRNHFPLVPATRYAFVVGGIGITPVLPMLRALSERPDAPAWSLLYGGRSPDTMAFRAELAALRGGEVTLWPQDSHGLPDLDRALTELPPGTAVYCCGPEGLLEAVRSRTERLLPPGSLHLERFRAPDRPGLPPSDGGFEVELRRTGTTLRVPPDRTLLDVVREAVPGVPSSCEQGICGTCETKVLAGTPDHHDMLLTDEEREAGSTMMICVGRSRSARLTLDL